MCVDNASHYPPYPNHFFDPVVALSCWLCWWRQFPEDDGHCSTWTDREACQAEKSMFDNSERTCAWQENEAECVYRQVNFTIEVRALLCDFQTLLEQ